MGRGSKRGCVEMPWETDGCLFVVVCNVFESFAWGVRRPKDTSAPLSASSAYHRARAQRLNGWHPDILILASSSLPQQSISMMGPISASCRPKGVCYMPKRLNVAPSSCFWCLRNRGPNRIDQSVESTLRPTLRRYGLLSCWIDLRSNHSRPRSLILLAISTKLINEHTDPKPELLASLKQTA